MRTDGTQARDGRPKVFDVPAEPAKVCTQTAVTIAPDVGARHRQDLAFGSEEWARVYATLRNTIEDLNGYVKDPAHEALGAPARRRVRGIAAQSLLCAILLTAGNARRLRAHRQMVTSGKAPGRSSGPDGGEPPWPTSGPPADLCRIRTVRTRLGMDAALRPIMCHGSPKSSADPGLSHPRCILATPSTEFCRCRWVTFVADPWRPRQDSNLRSRLRRPMLYPLSYEGVLAVRKCQRADAFGQDDNCSAGVDQGHTEGADRGRPRVGQLGALPPTGGHQATAMGSGSGWGRPILGPRCPPVTSLPMQ